MVAVVDWRDLEVLENIGSGTFAEVYKATWSRGNGEEAMTIAIKEPNNDNIARENIEREIEFMYLVSHENIVSIFGSSENPQNLRPCILMEYTDCGSLYNYLHNGGVQERAYSYLDCLRWMHQCAKAMAHIHSMNPKVIHRDLKTQNLLLFQDYQILKICDFGTASSVDGTNMVGTVNYMAPEVMHSNAENKYTEKCDVYSIGIILWEVLAGRKPMSHLKNNIESVIVHLAGCGERPPLHNVNRYANCNDIKSLIKACWNGDPSKRPTMTIVESYLLEKLSSPATIFPNLADLYALSPGICFAKYAPPEGHWYHGQLDRSRAEARLRESGKVGSYLVRRSEHQQATYVLSLLTGKGCLHFDIEVMYGKLYFAGDKFDSLVDLVGYFTKFCNIDEADHLRLPVAPPETVNDKHRVVAILANSQRRIRKYTHLTFRRGDIFTVHNDMGGGLLWVTDFRSGEQGLIYRGFVEDLDGSIDPNVVHPWSHEVVPAYTKFLEAGPNSFVVVPSKEQPGDYSVHIMIDHRIREVPIRFRDAAYAIGERDRGCATLGDLIDYYRHTHISEGHSLGEPVQRYRQPHLKEPLLPEVAVRHIHESSQECFDTFFTMLVFNTKSLGELEMRGKQCDNWTKYNVFVICEGGRDLLFFGEEYNMFQELQPKGRIDLSRASLYECHESLWNRPHCWLLVESLAGKRKETYFCAESRECYDMCIAHLRPLCTFQLRNAQMDVPQSRQGAYLSVRVLTSVNVGGATQTQRVYLNFALDQTVVARSEAQMLGAVMWNIEFEFNNIPPDVRTLQIQVMRDNAHEEMFYMDIKLNTLDHDREEDCFYNLKSRFKKYSPYCSGKDKMPMLSHDMKSKEYLSGKFQLRTFYLNDFMLPLTAYAPLRELMIEFDILVFRLLSSAAEVQDHSWLANLLLRIFTREKCDALLVNKLCKWQISMAEETYTLYIADTLENTMLDLFMRRECSDYVKALLTETVQRIIASVGAAEDSMLQSLDWIAKDIFENEREICFPTSVTIICRNIQSIARSKWPRNRAKFTTCISEFIFRFVFCAALEDPQGFGLIDRRPSPQASRHLNRLSECLRQLATLQEFDSDRHPDMVGFNPFIREHKQSVIDLMDRFVSESEGKTLPEIAVERLTIITDDSVRDLNDIHYFCEFSSVKLARLKDSQWKEKLMNVTKALSEMKSQQRSKQINERERLPWPLRSRV